MNLMSSVSTMNRVGSAVAKKLNKIGIHTIRDLFYYFPIRYDDYQGLFKISDLKEGLSVSVKAQVELIVNRRSFKTRKMITEALVSDGSGSLKIVWFNQPYIIKNIKTGDSIVFSGVVKSNMIGLQLISPTYSKIIESDEYYKSQMIPIYSLTAGLSQKYLRFLIKQALFEIRDVPDFLPNEILEKNGLVSLYHALQGIHFPVDDQNLEDSTYRLKFDELFLMQFKGAIFRQLRNKKRSPIIVFREKEIRQLVEELPFKLTKAQKIAAWEILRDLEKNTPMNRLLSGDVGSGKTVVAAINMYCVALNNKLSLLMAPTEILAKQHFESLSKMLADKLDVCLLTRSYQLSVINKKLIENKKKDLIKDINAGKFKIILGTHALLTEKIILNELGLVIVDEQHRFGVEQRKIINEKSASLNKECAHFLSMTATPIPRSLALTMYGDLDLSTIDEMPVGRKAVITRVVENYNRQKAYSFIHSQVKKGRQVFVVCPLIAPSQNEGELNTKQIGLFEIGNEKKTVMTEYERLSKSIFPDLKIGYLHGKMSSKDKDEVMKKFKSGEIDILVSTAVVEVGVDIPNASVMMIEGAERFGLSQLHQFRGRVGRAAHQSYCLVFSTNEISDMTLERLKFFEKNYNGFKLAEKDLETRGPGEVFGTAQSGEVSWQLARPSDVNIIKLARETVFELVNNLDKYPKLKELIKLFTNKTHWE